MNDDTASKHQASQDPPPADAASQEHQQRASAYWRDNIRLLGLLLSVWFTVSYGCGILFVDVLNQFTLPGTGFPLGFWFAQQGAIYVFVVLIFVYSALMNRLEKKYGFSED